MRDLPTALAKLAQHGQTISYGALARQLEIAGPGSVAKLTAALEALMVEDTELGRPLRAALCHSRLSGDLPAQGFFEKAQALGRFDGTDPVSFVKTERARLFETAH